MSENFCNRHGPHEGTMFVDGHKNGRPWGEMRTYCVQCRMEEDAKKYPHHDHPEIKALRRRRIEQRLSLREMADRVGMRPSDISAIELGAYARGSDEVLRVRRELEQSS